jgi:phosphatidylserine decarboxylase
MKHKGKADKAAIKIIGASSAIGGAMMAIILVGSLVLQRPLFEHYRVVLFALLFLEIAFIIFTLYFFRDPDAKIPTEPKLVLAPGHGKVDAIEEVASPEVIGGRCQRISTFLSVVDVHVQNMPLAGVVRHVKHTDGKFLNAMAAESAAENENVLIVVDSAECPGQKIGIRLIAGLIARRILPWVTEGETVARGERMSLIQFGSRVDVYLPLNATVKVKLGDRVVGGESILATLA